MLNFDEIILLDAVHNFEVFEGNVQNDRQSFGKKADHFCYFSNRLFLKNNRLKKEFD